MDKLNTYKTILLHMEGALSRNEIQHARYWSKKLPAAAEYEQKEEMFNGKLTEITVRTPEYEEAFRDFCERNNNGTKIKQIVKAIFDVEEATDTRITDRTADHIALFETTIVKYWEAVDADCK